MELKFRDIQETALIPLAIRESKTARPHVRIKVLKVKETIDTLGVECQLYETVSGCVLYLCIAQLEK